jgi:hypothetical protein
MPGDINFNIEKLPESPWFWLIVAILVEVGLFAAGKPATGFLILALGVGILCLISNLNSNYPSSGLWAVVGVCAVLVVILGVFFVPSEWSTQVAPSIKILNPTISTPGR